VPPARIKHTAPDVLASQISQAIAIAKQSQARLFINDHWQLAIDYGAYGVHLGQEDLLTADLAAIAHAQLRLGISCHNLHDLATAHAIGPSYIGVGPIFPTRSKALTHPPLGLATLADWEAFSPYPIVAIGGIDLTNLAQIQACKVDGIAMLGAIAQAPAATMTAALKALN
jgi:thiamine-phosphate diphosphorylase